MKKVFALVLSLCALSLASAAKADPIGPDCPTCQGTILQLTSDFVDIGADPNTATFQFTLTIDTTGTVIPGAIGYDAIAIKVSSAAGLIGFDLVSATAGGPFAEFQSTLNSQGCGGGGGGFVCIQAGPGDEVPLGGIETFLFDITVADFDALINPGSVKVRFIDDQGRKAGDLISERIPLQCPPGLPNCVPPPFLVPEPDTLALLGLAFVAIAAVTNRRRRIR